MHSLIHSLLLPALFCTFFDRRSRAQVFSLHLEEQKEEEEEQEEEEQEQEEQQEEEQQQEQEGGEGQEEKGRPES